ncbi:MAG: hypothetical protein CEN89_335 [Candidatus Berkelbacteria bacterium Licking1014_7]|uniref:Fibronectin type-III domain-containing protein n=1 Tax=Candidatus Berkelbacteria bacterium Licking1014_7 TaxID=2017147 RepID=A0A554LJD5_9BACT|nr:MAG: hypothetical protein CEN89_335 [Candidatus Berkelbacteria bacterium Licking1014_7]
MRKIMKKIKRFFIHLSMLGLVLQMSGLANLGLAAQTAQAANTIVINEIRIAGSSADDEFIELYNPTASPIDLSALPLKIHIVSSTGNDENRTLTFINTTISANGFFLIGPSSGYNGTVNLDATYSASSGNMLVNNGSAYISTSISANTDIIDQINWGTTGVLANPANYVSWGRVPDGKDTDSASDWVMFSALGAGGTANGGYPTPGESNVPSFVFVLPTSPAYTKENTYTISGEATKNRTIRIYDQNGTELSSQTSDAATGTFSFIVNLTANQTNNFSLTVENGIQTKSLLTQISIINETAAPTSTVATDGFYGPNTWIGISGTASDAGSGINQVKITLQRMSDLQYWNRTGWGVASSELTAAGAESWSYALDKANLTDGVTYEIKAKATDKAGNTEATSTATFTYDTTAPTGTIVVNSGKPATHSREVVLTITGYDATAGINEMRISEDKTFSAGAPAWENFSTSKNFTLSSASGSKQVYVQLKDRAGNVSADEIFDSITYIAGLVNDEINIPTTAILSAGGQLNATAEYGAEMTVSSQTQGTVFASIATYKSNPGTLLENQGIVVVGGNYYDFSLDNDTAFPSTIRIYYTQPSLMKAGITNESQIVGMYYYDSDLQKWLSYAGAVVNTTNFNGYEGYVEVIVSRLTPIVIAADITAPEAPANFKAESGDQQVKLSWNTVSDAVSYIIRYRVKSSISSYSQAEVSKDKTETTISGLNDGTEYEFAVSAKDKAGNISAFAIVAAATNPSAPTTLPTATVVLASTEVSAKVAEVVNDKKTEELVKTEEPVKQVKSAEDENGASATDTDRKRLIVALVILVIAIAAGIGGYYLYEWWVSKPEGAETSVKKTKKKGGKNNGRW